MASLQSSFTALAAAPNRRRNPQFLKPSRLATAADARRSHRFRVSCNGGIDRRNMLLGLGGLYGASGLVSGGRSAEASPLQPPDLSTCDPRGAYTTKTDNTVVELDVNCCPPYTDAIADYRLPAFRKLKVRPPAHRLSPAYVAKYELAMKRMRDLDKSDPDDPRGFTQQANIHCAYCNGPYDQVGLPGVDIQVHNSWIFFPFHRWYLYFYERILGELIGDPTFALPYWNWDNPKGMQMPKIFDNENSPLYDVNRDPAHRPPALVDLARTTPPVTDPAQIFANNLTQMYQEMIGQVEEPIDFFGQPYRAGDLPPPRGNMGTSEKGSHSGVHIWTGNPANPNNEDLGNFYSAGRDPIFYAHHSNVDRMWTLWKDIPTDYPKDINDADFKEASYLFYDEKKNLVRVRAGDCFDHTKLGYKYQHSDTPWKSYRPSQKLVPADVVSLRKRAQRPDRLFPLTLTKTVRILVQKPAKGKTDEVLLLENLVTDSSKLVRFDVFVNDEDDRPQELDRAEFAGGFTQVPHRTRARESPGSFKLNLKQLYENINISDDDDSIVVTIVPHINGETVTIGGIKIIPRVSA